MILHNDHQTTGILGKCDKASYPPSLRVTSNLTQMILNVNRTFEDKVLMNTSVREFCISPTRLAILSDYYSSAIINAMSYIPVEEDDTTEVIMNKNQGRDRLINFAHNLVDEFNFPIPDLNIVYIPYYDDMEQDIQHRLSCTKSLTKLQARMIKETYRTYLSQSVYDSYKFFTKHGEVYPPIYLINRSNVILPDASYLDKRYMDIVEDDDPLHNIDSDKRLLYRSFNHDLTKQQANHISTISEVADQIVNIIKLFLKHHVEVIKLNCTVTQSDDSTYLKTFSTTSTSDTQEYECDQTTDD